MLHIFDLYTTERFRLYAVRLKLKVVEYNKPIMLEISLFWWILQPLLGL